MAELVIRGPFKRVPLKWFERRSLMESVQSQLHYLPGYSFVWLVRALVTEKLPSGEATTLSQAPSAPPLRLAIRSGGLLWAASESSAVWSCQRSSRPGLSWMVCQASGLPALCAPLSMMATRGWIASTKAFELERLKP